MTTARLETPKFDSLLLGGIGITPTLDHDTLIPIRSMQHQTLFGYPVQLKLGMQISYNGLYENTYKGLYGNVAL